MALLARLAELRAPFKGSSVRRPRGFPGPTAWPGAFSSVQRQSRQSSHVSTSKPLLAFPLLTSHRLKHVRGEEIPHCYRWTAPAVPRQLGTSWSDAAVHLCRRHGVVRLAPVRRWRFCPHTWTHLDALGCESSVSIQ